MQDTDMLPPSYTARAATLDDVDIAVELANACSIEVIGRPEWAAHQFENDWRSPSLNPATDLHLVFAVDGTLVGYGGVWDAAPHVRLFGWGNVRPTHRGQGIGTYLAAWVEERARRSLPQAPQGTRVVLRQSLSAADRPGHDFLLAHGYQVVRRFAEMRIDLDALPPEPSLPEGIAIRTFDVVPQERPALLKAVVEANRDAFRDHWGYVEHPFEQEIEEWVHWIDNDPDHDPSLWFLAVEGEQIVGMSLCMPKVVEDPNMGYVDTLAVRRPWRRQGIALALLHHSFREFYRRGKRSVGLGVDADSLTGAVGLYEKAGMHVDREGVTYELELRPGKDLTTQALEE